MTYIFSMSTLHVAPFLISQLFTIVMCIDYLKESEKLAMYYEKTYGHQLVSLEPDEIELKALKTLAFGSCHSLRNAPTEGTTIWDKISAYKPDLFLWIGDAVYSNETNCDVVKQAYIDMKKYKPYVEFAKDTRVDGVYDDHDYGINDGDRYFPCKYLTKTYFLDFINKPKDHYRRNRDGVYFSIEYRDPKNPNNVVKIILLDVRFNRDPYRHHSHRGKGKISFFLESFRRSIDAYFNLHCSHKGDFLGETQWQWLEGQLHNSKASAHILISSIQVYNKCNYQESWKLLPYAQKRLTTLLFKTQPKGLVILSGDVHYANIEGDQNLYEITSSSMTHSFKIKYSKISYILSILAKHNSNDPYFYNNFGLIKYEYKDHMEATYLLVNDQGEIVRTYLQRFDESINPYRNLSKSNILCYFFHECFMISKCLAFLIFILAVPITYSFYMIFIKFYKKKEAFDTLI